MRMIRRLSKLWVAVIVAALSVSSLGVAAAEKHTSVSVLASGVAPFKDVPAGYWAESVIRTAVSKGYVSGYPDGTFKPDQNVTRAEFMRMLVSALKLPHDPEGSPWYQPYVAALVDAGIHRTQDFGGNFNKPLTRFEMVKLAVRAVEESYRTGEVEEDPNYMVYQAAEKGILHGTSAGNLDLEGTTTRAQAVAIIERILAVRGGRTLPVDKYALGNAELLWHRTNLFTVMGHIFNDPINETLPADVGIRSWKMENLVLENENFRGELTELIVIDLSDPKDPNRKLLPAMDKMYTHVRDLPVPEDAYVLVMRYRIDKNLKPRAYPGHMDLEFIGYDHRNEPKVNRPMLLKTSDSRYEWINEIKDGTAVWVVPGSGFKTYGTLKIQLNSYYSFGYDKDFLQKVIVDSAEPRKVW